MKRFYAVWVGDKKLLGVMKKWQAYYLAFHVWVTLRGVGNKRKVEVRPDDWSVLEIETDENE